MNTDSSTMDIVETLISNWFGSKWYSITNIEGSTVNGVFLKNCKYLKSVIIPAYTLSILKRDDKNDKYDTLSKSDRVLSIKYSDVINFNNTRLNKVIKLWDSLSIYPFIRRLKYRDSLYYMGPGILLDKDFNPLILATCLADILPNSDDKWYVHTPSIIIHPDFINDKIWRRFILTYLMPVCRKGLPLQTINLTKVFPYAHTWQPIEVKIGYMDEFIRSVKPLDLSSDATDIVHDFVKGIKKLPDLIDI